MEQLDEKRLNTYSEEHRKTLTQITADNIEHSFPLYRHNNKTRPRPLLVISNGRGYHTIIKLPGMLHHYTRLRAPNRRPFGARKYHLCPCSDCVQRLSF